MMSAMGRRRFTVSAVVAAPPAAALDFLADLHRHRGLHPFLVSAEVVAEGDDWREWQVHERPRLGPLGYSVRFRARLVRTRPDRLLGQVRLPPGVRLDSDTTATVVPAGTRLVETTDVVAPGPLLGYVARNAERAHARTFALLPGELASG